MLCISITYLQVCEIDSEHWYNVCLNCGEYRADKIIDRSGSYAVCPLCKHEHPFLQLPLLIVSGASGSGKSAIRYFLTNSTKGVIMLEGDLLWRPEFDKPNEKYRDFFETWLRLCKNISQAGKPVVIFNAGFGVRENVEPCVERRYFSKLHYLALTCDDEVLPERLRARPQWRKSGKLDDIKAQILLNRWFKEQAGKVEPFLELIDTTDATIEESSNMVALWIQKVLSNYDLS